VFLLRLPKVDEAVAAQHRPAPDPDEMVMDPQTYRDLEIFECPTAQSLYDLCNTTRTVGGAKALTARMKKPWNRADRIRDVQESIAFIRETRAAFDRLPSALVAHESEQYLTGGLPLASSEKRVEFLFEALGIRFGDFRYYSKIVRGVNLTSKLVRALRHVVRSPGFDPTAGRGDVAPLLSELALLVERPGLKIVPEAEDWSIGSVKVLQIDRVFRLKERAAVERMLELTYEIDALVAMCDATSHHGWVIPEVVAGPPQIEGERVFHPFVQDPVPNDVRLGQTHHVLFLTGPNMAGKTTYLRSCGIATYLAHLGMGVPARSFRFSPCERLFSSITVTDDVRGGVSYFRAEALRVKAIAQAVTDGLHVIALMDEPFKGTNVKDAVDASLAVLRGLIARPGNLFMVSSHLIELGDEMLADGRVDCRRFEADEREGHLLFDYVLRPGVSSQRLGMRVLLEEGIFTLLETDGARPATHNRG
jgi:DNA mismatch repair ATPase MutS